MTDQPRNTKEKLMKDIESIWVSAAKRDYMFGVRDAFAIGYMAAKFGLERLIDNQEELLKACQEYDKTDDLALLDTIGETLVDLDVMKWENN